jgi:hypothetical protein
MNNSTVTYSISLTAIFAVLIGLLMPTYYLHNTSALSISVNMSNTTTPQLIKISPPAPSISARHAVPINALSTTPDDDVNTSMQLVPPARFIISPETFEAAMAVTATQCDESLWNHVYHPWRLNVISPCITVSGVIDVSRVERDGDVHILLHPDSQFANLTNQVNVDRQFGDLVLEPVCVHQPTQPDAVGSCQNFHDNISIPPVGSHVVVSGPYVLDEQHGGWAEIHPITSISVA